MARRRPRPLLVALVLIAAAGTPTGPAVAQTPRPGGELPFVVGSEPPSYDGHQEETFGLIHAVTQGGPGDATSILVYRAWTAGFDGLQLGYSAAQSVILMLLVIALTAAQFRYAEQTVTY